MCLATLLPVSRQYPLLDHGFVGTAARVGGHAVGGDTQIGKEGGDEMFMALFVVLVAAWLLGWGAFHVAGGLIHLLLIVAVISLIVHLMRGRRATV
jgi:hypothetical protein